ncbi:hypothetical protein L1987_87231 [Smallanthus sonchifolius]|nr:hypothetical protein L1987_87231 [Smallanthus sonchifolius]
MALPGTRVCEQLPFSRILISNKSFSLSEPATMVSSNIEEESEDDCDDDDDDDDELEILTKELVLTLHPHPSYNSSISVLIGAVFSLSLFLWIAVKEVDRENAKPPLIRLLRTLILSNSNSHP